MHSMTKTLLLFFAATKQGWRYNLGFNIAMIKLSIHNHKGGRGEEKGGFLLPFTSTC